MKEETNLDVILKGMFCEFTDEKDHGYYYLCDRPSGEMRLGGPEVGRQSEDNIYEFVWVPISNLAKINMVPIEIKQKIIEVFG